MKTNEALRELLTRHNKSLQDIADALSATLGKRVLRQNVWNRLNGDYGFSINTTLDYLNELGYEIAFVPKGKTLPANSIVVDEKNEGRAHPKKDAK